MNTKYCTVITFSVVNFKHFILSVASKESLDVVLMNPTSSATGPYKDGYNTAATALDNNINSFFWTKLVIKPWFKVGFLSVITSALQLRYCALFSSKHCYHFSSRHHPHHLSLSPIITSHHLSSPLITSHHLSSPLTIISHHLSSSLISLSGRAGPTDDGWFHNNIRAWSLL